MSPGGGAADAAVIDIGGDTGALIVYLTEGWVGVQIDLTPAGQARNQHLHAIVRRWQLTDRDVLAGLFPEVQEGSYTVWGPDGPLGEVAVQGGSVAELDATVMVADDEQGSPAERLKPVRPCPPPT